MRSGSTPRRTGLPDLVQAFDPPLVLAEGDVLEPMVPVDLPEGCRSLPG